MKHKETCTENQYLTDNQRRTEQSGNLALPEGTQANKASFSFVLSNELMYTT